MCKKKFYAGIKRTIYRRFEKLEIVEQDNGNDIYLMYKNDGNIQVLIKKNYGNIYYYYGYKIKILRLIPMGQLEFELLLSRWVEERFEMKVNDIWKQYKCTVG